MPRRRLTWPHVLDVYEQHLRAQHASPLTVEEHLRELGHLSQRLDPLRPDQVGLGDLRTYQVGLLSGETSHSGRALAARTVAKTTSIVRRFFRFLAEEGLLREDPAARLEQPRCPRKGVGDVLTVRQVERLLGAADTSPIGLRDRAVVEVLYGTGLRRAELVALDLGDLCREERVLTVRRGKGGRGRRAPLARSTYQALATYLELARAKLATSHPDSAQALFLSQRGMRMNHMGLNRTLKKLAQAAGLKVNVSPHTMRRSFATHLLQGGASLRHIQLLLGHRDLATTSVYLKLDTSELRREVLLKHPRERFEP